ncbi:MAG: hypothetical protein GX608_13905 [Lentisphaerae bacterium]|nr:hypothetical protein [Lentisphaerota bacterium]
MIQMRDQFLSEEDLDLKSLSPEELESLWTEWLIQAQITNDSDSRDYSHGVFIREPPWDDGSTILFKSETGNQKSRIP